MKQIQMALWMAAISTFLFTLLLYQWYHISKFHTIQPDFKTLLTSVDKRVKKIIKQEYIVDTVGCQIPISVLNFKKHAVSSRSIDCGKRAVLLKKFGPNAIQYFVDERILSRYLGRNNNFYCCYRFFKQYFPPRNIRKLRYSSCILMQSSDVFKLEDDFINVQCFEKDLRNNSRIIYDDVYSFIKRKNNTNKNKSSFKNKYNVLILGLDSMSLRRLEQTMTRTAEYLKKNLWLSFKGYHKIGDNTIPNIMAALTGKNISSIIKNCAGNMFSCNDFILWSHFKRANYVTAYGEDYLRLPDTFSRSYAFRSPPTDHYMRPFFLKSELEIGNKSQVCSGKYLSGQHVLDYAFDFVHTYRKVRNFGFFWINSFSHNIHSRPEDADKLFEEFFKKLSDIAVLNDTFIFFFSDHGIRFGDQRMYVGSYYDERLPFLFTWIPDIFKLNHPNIMESLKINQYRLITPYDLFLTIRDVNHIHTEHKSGSEGCPKCQSMFDVVNPNRTCQDVAVNDKWCGCHELYPLLREDNERTKTVQFVVSHIKSTIASVKTKSCWTCTNLSLGKVNRVHYYYDKEGVNIYYVVAITLTPGNMSYEATIMKDKSKLHLIGQISVISPYRNFGKCTIQYKDRLFCVCEKIVNCKT